MTSASSGQMLGEAREFKGYESFLVQDMVISALVTNFLRECWRTTDGKTLTARLRAGVDGISDLNCAA